MKKRLFVTPLENRVTPYAVGGLDLTFGNSGIFNPNVLLNIPNGSNTAVVLGRQSTGKIIVGSTAFLTGTDTDFAVYRLNTDGTIDLNFGTGGLTTVSFDLGSTKADVLNAITVLPDDSIVAVGSADRGSSNRDFAIAKLKSNGELDTTFNTTGTVTIAFDITPALDDIATAVTIDSQSRIIIAGNALASGTTDFDFAVARLTASGKLDSTFSGDGRQIIPFDLSGGTLSDTVTGVDTGSNNSVIIVGNVNNGGSNTDVGITRLLENGTLDSSFNSNGKRTYALDNTGSTKENTATNVVVLSDDRIVFGGSVATTGTAGTSDFYAARILANSSPDSSFGVGGFATVGLNFGGTKADRAQAIAVDGLGRVVLAGTTQIGATDTDYGIARLTSQGTVDSSFNGTGVQRVEFDLGGNQADSANSVFIQPNGRILIGGLATNTTFAQVGVARLHGTLGLDSTLLVSGLNTGGVQIDQLDNSNKFVNTATKTIFSNYSGPVRSATADFNGDGVADLAYGIGPNGGSLVRIVDGATGSDLLTTRNTYESGFTGGLFVAAGDIDGDGFAELAVSPDQGGGGRVQIFSVNNNNLVQRDNFFGIDDQAFRGGARIALGDFNNDSRLDLIVGAGFTGGPRTAVFNGLGLLKSSSNPIKLINDFFAFPGADAVSLRNGVFVAAGDLNGDGFAEMIFGGGPGGGPRVYALNGSLMNANQLEQAYNQPVANFFVANDSSSRGGVRLAVKDIDDDNRADLIVASGDNRPTEIRSYLGVTVGSLVGSEQTGAVWQTLNPFDTNSVNGVFVG